METHQSVARWEGDTLEIYISTQFIWGIRDAVSGQLELPPDNVRVVCNYMGGGFGAKNGPGDYTYIAIALAGKTGRPVRCALTRREENLATGNRNATIQKLRAGARSDGTLVALDAEFVNTIGWSGCSGPTYGPIEMLYACENVRTQTYGAKLNMPPNAAFRAPGLRRGHVRARVRARRARREARARPARAAAAQPRRHDLVDGRPFSSKNLMECYDRAEPHWERRDEVRARSEGPWRRGVGLASQIWYGGGGPPSYAWVRVGSDGRAVVITAMQDIGTGTRTAMAQIAAEELGLPLERVRCELGDSARGPYAVDLGRLVDDALDGPGGARRGRRRGAADHRDRGAALRPRGARALARRTARSSPPTAAPGRSRR